MKILIIGSLPPPVGGTTVSLLHLVDRLRRKNEIDIEIINTSVAFNLSVAKRIIKYGRLTTELLLKTKKSDIISLHVSSSSIVSVGLLVLLISTITRKPLVIRKFGGTDYNSFNLLKRIIIRFVLKKCNLYLAQTKHLVEVAKRDKINNVMWYPTSRPMHKLNSHNTPSQFCRKFVYVGQVKRSKGIMEIVEASKGFDQNIIIDIYGNLNADIDIKIFSELHNVNYRGPVEPEKVSDVLKQYDALLFPSYHSGEGYAGAIIEAYSVGIPVIATRWQANMEIVNDYTGILIEPKNSNDLYVAMKRLSENADLYRELRKGVMHERSMFLLDRWVDFFVSACRTIVNFKK